MAHEHVDVLIVGAGLSGVGAACHLRRRCPGRSFAILEAREAMGGTWDLFRYPGIRSDSDMFTLGYSFRPWKEAKAIADGPSIRRYIRETAREHAIEPHVRYRHRVVRAAWSSAEARWTVEAHRGDTGETVTLTCAFLIGATGYYRYDEGFTPEFPGLERFTGTVVHPQHWPAELEYTGRRVVVIGSGATAVTLVPALAERAAHVTMLQRSPTYIVALPSRDVVADGLRRLLPERLAYAIVRWKNVLVTGLSFQISRRWPKVMKGFVRRMVERRLPDGFDTKTHFRPRYDPWDQRLCVVPDGDLFRALSRGSASIVTDQIATFTERGIRLASGEELEADVVVTATGLNLQALGGMALAVDGREVDLADTVGYKGIMFSDIPNAAVLLGYTNASWTLKCDLACEYVCRLLNHMDRRGHDSVTPRKPDPSVPLEPIIDLKAGYVLRSIDAFPRQADRTPWRLHQNYARDIAMLRHAGIEDGVLRFGRAGTSPAPEPAAA